MNSYNYYAIVDNIYPVCELQYGDWAAYDTLKDHSKWVIGSRSDHKWVCMLDNNHACTQQSRGGTAFCFQSANIYNLFYDAITNHEQGCDGAITSQCDRP